MVSVVAPSQSKPRRAGRPVRGSGLALALGIGAVAGCSSAPEQTVMLSPSPYDYQIQFSSPPYVAATDQVVVEAYDLSPNAVQSTKDAVASSTLCQVLLDKKNVGTDISTNTDFVRVATTSFAPCSVVNGTVKGSASLPVGTHAVLVSATSGGSLFLTGCKSVTAKANGNANPSAFVVPIQPKDMFVATPKNTCATLADACSASSACKTSG